MGFVLAIYAIGVAIGLALTDARPLARASIALLWPLGIVTFAVTIAVLLLAAMLVFPAFGVAVLAAAVAGLAVAVLAPGALRLRSREAAAARDAWTRGLGELLLVVTSPEHDRRHANDGGREPHRE